MHPRRSFLRTIGTAIATLPFSHLNSKSIEETDRFINRYIEDNFSDQASDDQFWHNIKMAYSSSANMLDLNSGGVSSQPIVVQQAFKRYNDICNEAPSFYMWREFRKQREGVRQKLANFAGTKTNEIALVRNTTEALDTIIKGYPLQKEDEVVVSHFDYPNMKNVWKMREFQEGIKLKWVTFPAPCEDEATLVKAYTDQFTKNTKLVHLTHVINWTGQILPIKKIAAAAHKQGIEVLVDGAHSFAQLDFKISELEADYFGTSLHKWMCAPFGTGMLYINEDKIEKILPCFPGEDPKSGLIKKFENLGTLSIPAELAIGNALNFHLAIGTKRKQERLYFLKNYWTSKVEHLEKVKIHTPKSQEFSGAIAVFSIEGKSIIEIATALKHKHNIHTTSVKVESVEGIRITPNVFTQTYDLDRLVKAIKEIART